MTSVSLYLAGVVYRRVAYGTVEIYFLLGEADLLEEVGAFRNFDNHICKAVNRA